MAFTAAEIENVANAAIDFHMDRGTVYSQTIQNKPLLAAMRRKSKTFPGGKVEITVRVKGVYTTTIQGFTYDDQVTYKNPANIKTAKFPWKLIHSGIEVTMHELLNDGISVVDTTTGRRTSEHSQREMTMLANLLEDKLEDMTEGTDRGMNDMLWKDGTQDAKQVPGILSIILDDPTAAGTVGGIDQVANTWWRNRAKLDIDISAGPGDMPVHQTIQNEMRQLRRYGGSPDLFLAGSDMLDQIEKEQRANGMTTDSGWYRKGGLELTMDDATIKGTTVVYDPTLDDLTHSKRLYAIDTNAIRLMPIEDEDMKRHFPARPEDKYVFYRALTWVGGLTCRQRNSSGVYSFENSPAAPANTGGGTTT